MTKEDFINKYTYGLEGNEPVPFGRVVAVIEDIVDRGCGSTQDLTASTVGLAAIGAGTGFVTITASNADHIVHLPAVADLQLGHVLRGEVGDNGCEIRVAVADDDTVALNNNHVSHIEAALPAVGSFIAVLVTATAWILTVYADDGTVTAPTPDA